MLILAGLVRCQILEIKPRGHRYVWHPSLSIYERSESCHGRDYKSRTCTSLCRRHGKAPFLLYFKNVLRRTALEKKRNVQILRWNEIHRFEKFYTIPMDVILRNIGREGFTNTYNSAFLIERDLSRNEIFCCLFVRQETKTTMTLSYVGVHTVVTQANACLPPFDKNYFNVK